MRELSDLTREADGDCFSFTGEDFVPSHGKYRFVEGYTDNYAPLESLPFTPVPDGSCDGDRESVTESSDWAGEEGSGKRVRVVTPTRTRPTSPPSGLLWPIR